MYGKKRARGGEGEDGVGKIIRFLLFSPLQPQNTIFNLENRSYIHFLGRGGGGIFSSLTWTKEWLGINNEKLLSPMKGLGVHLSISEDGV